MYDIIISSMDEDEGQGKSLGAYENMERSDIRPSFYSGADEEDKKSEKSSAARDALKAGENAAANKVVEAGLNAVTGGAAGTAMKAANAAKNAEAVSDASGNGGSGQKSSSTKGLVKKAAPVAIIALLVIFLVTIVSLGSNSLFGVAFKNINTQFNNSTKVSTVARTDALTNNTQLGDSGSSEAYSGVVFEDIGFTEEQVQSLNDAGIDYLDGGGEKALRFHLADGSTPVVTSDKSVGVMNGEAIARGEGSVTDSGNLVGAELEERKQEIIDNLGIAATTSSVMGFSEAMQNYYIKEQYMTGTRSWRGDISGWFSEMTETVVARLGISRNNFKDFKLTGDNAQDEENFKAIAASLPTSSTEVDLGDKSYKERVEEAVENSTESNCGAISAANDIEGVTSAAQSLRQMSAGSLILEAIDKTMAGEGTYAPLSVILNIWSRSGGMNTESINHLFGSGSLNQNDNLLLSASAQSNIGQSGTADFGALSDEERYRQCVYEGNTNNDEHGLFGGALIKIGSMFKRAINWLKNLIGGAGSGAANIATAFLEPTIAKYEQTVAQTYFADNENAVIGEAAQNAAERFYEEKAKTAGQTVGDNNSLLAFYRAQQEVIAEQAEYDRHNKSPFDITNQNTFLGSIAYSLIPLATSSQALSLTSAVSDIGSVFSDSVISLLPTSSAVSETDFTFSRGDCVLANSIKAISNGRCNQYYESDLSLSSAKAVEIFDEVAYLREDKKGYIFGMGNCLIGGKFIESIYQDPNYCEKGVSDPDYGIDPLNDAESSAGHHWPEDAEGKEGDGTPNGCETDWAHETRYRNPIAMTGPYEYYFFDYPIEWAYSRSTNFEYLGYESGWHNRTANGSVGIEKAVNDTAPGQCVLDMKVNENDKQPVINMNGALMTYMILSGQRGSEWGSTDNNNLQRLMTVDFTKGRLHPDKVGANNDNVLHPDKDSAKKDSESIYEELKWSGDEETTAGSRFMSRWIGGTAYVMRTAATAAGDLNDKIYNVFITDDQDEAFKDPTMDNHYFWEEMRWYQAYTELLEWLEAIGKIRETETSKAVARYYEENPLDNSYEGIIARYSGMSKERVIAVLDLINYTEYLAQYDPSELGPVFPTEAEQVYYEETELIAAAEPALRPEAAVYDELRNRAVTV